MVVAMSSLASELTKPDPTTPELREIDPEGFDPEKLRFEGLRGATARHLTREQLVRTLAALPSAPRDRGTLELLVARGPRGERSLPQEVTLTPDGGMPGDRWAIEGKYGPAYQLATIRADFARVIANGQPLHLHGDNLYVQLDLSATNLPPGSICRLGEALLRVTSQPHNGCKKWVQRFGLPAMHLNLDPDYRDVHLRGIYFQVLEAGRVRVGDDLVVRERTLLDRA
jgi:hypothetical protein